MKELGNKFIANLHIFIILYGLYGAWVMYDEHSLKMEELETQFPAVQAEIEINQKKLSEIKEFEKKQEEFQVRVEQAFKNIEDAQKQLPAEINDTSIITFINQEFSILNIKDTSITPGKEDTSVYYIAKEYSFKATGTFLQFLVFFERVGGADRIYNMKSLKLNAGSERTRGRFQMVSADGVIQAFRMNPNFRAREAAAGGGTQAGAP